MIENVITPAWAWHSPDCSLTGTERNYENMKTVVRPVYNSTQTDFTDLIKHTYHVLVLTFTFRDGLGVGLKIGPGLWSRPAHQNRPPQLPCHWMHFLCLMWCYSYGVPNFMHFLAFIWAQNRFFNFMWNKHSRFSIAKTLSSEGDVFLPLHFSAPPLVS